jgi:transposase
VLKRARQQPEKYPWLTQLLARRPFKVVAVALANKMARVAWALLANGGTLLSCAGACHCGYGSDLIRSRAKLRLWVTNCKGDDDVDAKRSRPSIGKPVMGHAILERAFLGPDQRITSGPAATAAASRRGKPRREKQAAYMAAPERFADRSDSSCTAGAVHTWPIATCTASHDFGSDRSNSGHAVDIAETTWMILSRHRVRYSQAAHQWRSFMAVLRLQMLGADSKS